MEGSVMDGIWQADLERWLAPFVAALRHETRARMYPVYIAGLIGPGDRKSVQPMGAGAGTVSYDKLPHFGASGVGTPRRWKRRCSMRPTDGLVGTTPS
ncbi:hypothetical protein PPNSA23_41880 [Phyllobacterium phragmitis]|uniref:Transposase IS701-like DDE domain-containing protein n=1 Tax=Phyllobacterium phragmitis TaxID=2670329 RepID=A0ABQ0H5R5_9HYPH